MEYEQANEILRLLAQQSEDVRRAVFDALRREFGIHPLEQRLNISAETILEAIDRSSDLTLRGVRGVIAEAVFKQYVLPPMLVTGWIDKPLLGDGAFDFLLGNGEHDLRIQVKMQRQRRQHPMLANEANKKLFNNAGDMWVVETQRTRGGKNASGEKTRPYRFGDFDILAVSLHPATKDWTRFIYTLGAWLVADPTDPLLVFKYQPIPRLGNQDWTESLSEAIGWFQHGETRTISKIGH